MKKHKSDNAGTQPNDDPKETSVHEEAVEVNNETTRTSEADTAHVEPVLQVQPDKEITTSEDKSLEVSDAVKGEPILSAKPHKRRLLTYLSRRKRWLIPLVLVLVVVVLGIVPTTRYGILGLFIKEDFKVTVVDDTTHTPVIGAIIHVGNVTATTNADGKATVKVPTGNASVSISKQYYKSATNNVVVTLSSSENVLSLNLTATGRQVPVMVMNKINNQPVANAAIKVLDTTAQTDKSGKATIVLPTNAATQQGTITVTGYNTIQVPITVTSQAIAANTFTMVPSGKVYFLSNLSGKIDVASTNLDGSDRTTVVAGTGTETPDSTALLASRDWKYLALQSKRDTSGQSRIYLITASTNNLSVIDEGSNVTFQFIGWSGDNFVYTVDRQKAINATYDQTVLKSFNASTGHITTIDQTDAIPATPDFTFVSSIDTNLVSDGILYTKSWNISKNGYFYGDVPVSALASKALVIIKTKSDGSGSQTLKTINASDDQYIQSQVAGSNEVYYRIRGAQPPWVYLKYEDGSIQPATDVNDNTFYSNTYATYLLSPSGNNTFWSVPTDGKNNLLVGDQNGNNATTVSKVTDYNTYGWYSDSYLLVSKGGSELYILPVGGGNALKITDYYKPSQFFRGYGGGYGGI